MTARRAKQPSALRTSKARTTARLLTETDKLAGFKACTGGLPKWHAEQIAAGMTDAELAKVLEQVIGIMGGRSAMKSCPAVSYRGAGLKIWVAWDWPDEKLPPTYSGATTLAVVREVYGIRNPEDQQLQLF
jgi:hypothetical protein